jgi:hypothetical protein
MNRRERGGRGDYEIAKNIFSVGAVRKKNLCGHGVLCGDILFFIPAGEGGQKKGAGSRRP